MLQWRAALCPSRAACELVTGSPGIKTSPSDATEFSLTMVSDPLLPWNSYLGFAFWGRHLGRFASSLTACNILCQGFGVHHAIATDCAKERWGDTQVEDALASLASCLSGHSAYWCPRWSQMFWFGLIFWLILLIKGCVKWVSRVLLRRPLSACVI